MKLPSLSNIAGGVGSLAAWGITDVALPYFGITLTTDQQVAVNLVVNLLVTHIAERIPAVAEIDAKLKGMIVASYPTEQPASTSAGAPNGNYNRTEPKP